MNLETKNKLYFTYYGVVINSLGDGYTYVSVLVCTHIHIHTHTYTVTVTQHAKNQVHSSTTQQLPAKILLCGQESAMIQICKKLHTSGMIAML